MPTGSHPASRRIFGAPLRYIQGPGALSETGPTAAAMGPHALLVADAFVLEMVEPAVTGSCRQAGTQVTPLVFAGEITPAEIERLVTAARALPAHVVIAAGGGKGIDAGKAVAHRLQLPVVTLPTIASNDAPTSKIYVVYDEQHRLLKVEHMPCNPHAVIVDTALIAKAPRKLLLAGIGDAISKKFEVAQCHAAQGPNIFGGLGTRAALALADLCFDTLLAHADGALAALERQSPDPSLEAIVEASVLLSGLCFENGGLSVAHSMTRGLSALPETAHELHGLQVAYGTMVQWQLERRPATFMDEMRAFYRRIGLPMNLRQLGLPRAATDADIDTIAALTLSAPHMRNFDRPLSAQDLVQAMRAVESEISTQETKHETP